MTEHKTQYFDSTGELKWNGLIYPMRSFDVKNYTKISNAINEDLLSGEKFLKKQGKIVEIDPLHWSMQSEGARFMRKITQLDFTDNPIGEADIELML